MKKTNNSNTKKAEHPRFERTLVVLKPDSIQRSLIGEVIGRYERSGLKLVGMKMLVPSADLIEKHYTLDPEWRLRNGMKTIKGYEDKGLIPPIKDPLKANAVTLGRLIKYMTSGPVIALVWQGMHAVAVVKKLTGTTEPLMADVGTIRGDFVLDSYPVSDSDSRSTRNLVHASGSIEEARDEIAHWFKKDELMNYKIVQESILYDENLEGIFE